jgi:hypothetical protein
MIRMTIATAKTVAVTTIVAKQVRVAFGMSGLGEHPAFPTWRNGSPSRSSHPGSNCLPDLRDLDLKRKSTSRREVKTMGISQGYQQLQASY